MRHVQVWFSCDHEGCDAKSEWMVEAKYDYHGHALVTLTMPPGWGWRRRDLQHFDDTLGATFCPAHGAPDR